jgi:uncharacterized protein YbbC (DUF1343 family)
MKLLFVFFLAASSIFAVPKVKLGSDCLFEDVNLASLTGKRVALLTNQTGLDSTLRSTMEQLIEKQGPYQVVALFSPEHGLQGVSFAGEKVGDTKMGKIPCYSLHGNHRRPTEEMLKGIDVIIYDIQDVGSRCYTYTTTLFYMMEEAAKRKIEVIVLDRPNPMGGVIVDGPMLQEKEKSFLGYINVPYCHGMTIGELALFFNREYHVECKLKVIPMKGWKREMRFLDTGLMWTPTSPQIPEDDTPIYYPVTGVLGELELVNIGVGYTLPFKIIGTPWIDADKFAAALTNQKLPGVKFLPFHFKPFFGPYKHKECHGVRLVVTDVTLFRPVTAGYLIMGVLKSLYPHEVGQRLKSTPATKKVTFSHVNGTPLVLDLLTTEKYPGWKMASIDLDERKAFLEKRKKYLLY